MTKDILENIDAVQKRIHNACELSGRNPAEVKLLLATKTVSADRIKTALKADHTLIAENKIQELKEKYDELKSTPHTNHFIGHLQTNKVKFLLKYDVTCVQSIDRLKLAKKLQNRLEYEDKTIDVLIQVNSSYEDSKFGVAPDKAIELVKEVAKLDRITIKGLMTIGLLSEKTEKVRKCFKLLKK